MPTIWPSTIPIPHRKQAQASDCLAACVAMVLDYISQSMDYVRLLKLLDIGPLGTLRRNVLRLTQLGLDVVYREATLEIVVEYLQAGHPVIAFVDTAELSYWKTATNHAVVLIGLDADYVVLHDPAFDTAPHYVLRDEFELAWLNCNNACAIIQNATRRP